MLIKEHSDQCNMCFRPAKHIEFHVIGPTFFDGCRAVYFSPPLWILRYGLCQWHKGVDTKRKQRLKKWQLMTEKSKAKEFWKYDDPQEVQQRKERPLTCSGCYWNAKYKTEGRRFRFACANPRRVDRYGDAQVDERGLPVLMRNCKDPYGNLYSLPGNKLHPSSDCRAMEYQGKKD